ncbi:DUF1905 domain-containing protein [Glaciihabitans arcticus]|uniref:DUF1905 domain-containing protein n=1 Tax=Glaciihabitans arcticus TaxID=2668039 RepID=A0A4Q9GPA1_9MICO|nr:YdeI/OmpD-associated family protein [Glaciihabitans arcticus]TBN56652.1 DUF1905 domain-containing protein [Glaciihabitans arcticus]
MKFQTTLLQLGNNVGIEVPQSVIEELGSGKKPAVIVTINGDYTYRNTVGIMGGKSLLSLSAARRAASGYSGGDEVEISLELDTEPREVVIPAALQQAFNENPEAAAAFTKLSNSKQRAEADLVAAAKTDETRDKRVAKLLASLA